MYIIKSSGKRVKFSPNRIKRTCLKAGANRELALKVTIEIEKRIHDGIKTQEILKLVLKLLGENNPLAATRYNLKQAMLELGPAGFVFEEFIKRLLFLYGYETQLPDILPGACVEHEIDIIAKIKKGKNDYCLNELTNQDRAYMIECKYHNDPLTRTGLKDALCIWARFLDLKDAWRQEIGQKFDFSWLISNTKFSESAIQYANCKEIKLLGWHYPQNTGLEFLVENKKFYPITILRSLGRELKNKLFAHNIITCRDLICLKENFQNNNIKKSIQEAKLILGNSDLC